MNTQKLRVKVGPHEFEAEGSPESVTAQFDAWKELIARQTDSSPSTSQSSRNPVTVTEVRTREGFMAPCDIYTINEKNKTVTLRVHPVGEQRDADAALLVIYGYKQSFDQDEVPVTRIKDSLEESGLRPGRIDRTVAPHLNAGLLLKAGQGKGGKYRLTVTGRQRADELARKLFEQIA